VISHICARITRLRYVSTHSRWSITGISRILPFYKAYCIIGRGGIETIHSHFNDSLNSFREAEQLLDTVVGERTPEATVARADVIKRRGDILFERDAQYYDLAIDEYQRAQALYVGLGLTSNKDVVLGEANCI